MASEQLGMARLTNVVDPLYRLGRTCRDLEYQRRKLLLFQRLEAAAHSIVAGVILFGTLVSFGPLVGGIVPSSSQSAPLARLGASGAAEGNPRLTEAEGAHPKRVPAAQSAKMATLALRQAPMPAHTPAIQALTAAGQELATVPVDTVITALQGGETAVSSVPSALLTGLPPGGRASKGKETKPGEWAFDLADFDGVRVSLPKGTKEEVRVSLEINSGEGVMPQSFGFTIKPGAAVRLARNRSGRIEERTASNDDKTKAKPTKQPVRVSKGLANPNGLGMSPKKRQQPQRKAYEREEESYPPPEPRSAPSFGSFLGLF